MRRLLLAACTFFLIPCTFSQQPVSWTSSDMYLALRKLNVLGTVLYVAAHPDDENTRLITYFSKDKMYRTGYLSMTRGDGGQNLIGDEQGIELGMIRTQELLSARRIDGGEQFFSRAYDFGYSKNPEETFNKWNKDKILSDVVWVIRKFQPDVVITRFPTTGEGGHGHHTASAILANEAFTAAADPSRYPEQLKYVKTWQVKRVLWNVFGGSGGTDQFRIDVGGYNPLLGKSYGEIAAASRSQHKSQGFGVPAGRGEAFEYFRTTGGNAPVNDIMDDVDLTWKRVRGGEAIANRIDKIIGSFDLLHPENSVKSLVELYKAMKDMPESYWRDQKLKEVQQLIEQCSGLFLDATANEQYAVQTDSIRINISFNNRLGTNAVLKNFSLDGFDSSTNTTLTRNKNFNYSRTFFIPTTKPVTQPYWLQYAMSEGYFNVNDLLKIGQPDVDPAFVLNITLNIEGQDLVFQRSVKYKFTDPVRGELYQPLVVVPRVLVDVYPTTIIKTGKESYPFTVSVRPLRSFTANNASLLIDKSKGPDYLKKNFPSLERDRPYNGEFRMSDTVEDHNRLVKLANFNSSEIYGNTLKTIHYDHIPYISYYKQSGINYSVVDLKTVGKKIGYITGAGDKVPEALEQMGYDVTLLGDKELTRNNLQQFDAIITGVRAYNTNEWLNNHYDKLMRYVEQGGNMIVQYNTSSNIGPVRAKIGPYSFNISRTRVTDENAAVTFLKPDHPALNFPNKIVPADFAGWIQERSIYHASNWDKNFETVFSMHDPGENGDEGSLIISRYGKGTFVYTGIVFFRELPAGISGAYRLMANLIALNKQKAF